MGRKETVNQMDKQMFVRILNSEMELATGCTEPGAVALTAAEAGAALRKAGGTRVEAVTVRASINIIKKRHVGRHSGHLVSGHGLRRRHWCRRR